MIDDQQASILIEAFPQADPVMQAQIRPQIQEWHDATQKRLDAERSAREAQIRPLFSDVETLGGKWSKEMQAELGPFVPDANKARAQSANMAFLAHATEMPLERVAPVYDTLRDQYANENFNGPKDDLGFYTAIQGKFQQRDDRAAFEAKRKGDATSAAFLQAIDAGAPVYDSAYTDWQAKANTAKGYDPAQEGADFAQYRDTYQKAYEVARENRDLFSAVKSTLERSTKAINQGADLPFEAATRLMEAEPEKRKAVLQMLTAYAAHNQPEDPQGAVQQVGAFFKNMGVSYLRGIDPLRVTNTSRMFTLLDARKEIDALESGKEFMVNPDRPLGPKIAPGEIESADGSYTGSPWRPATPEERAQRLANAKKADALIRLSMELDRVAKNEIDPVKPVLTYMPDVVQRGFFGLAGSVPQMMAAAVPGVGMAWMTNSMVNQEFERLTLDHPEIDPEKGYAMALVSGGIQAVLERFQLKSTLGELPFTKGLVDLVTDPTSSFWRSFAIKGAANVFEQNLQEGLQDITPAVVQQTASALSKDIPGVDWKKELGDWTGSRAETFFAVLPLALLGTGVGSLKESRAVAQALTSPQTMVEAGILLEDAQRIATISNLSEKEAAFRQAWRDRTEESKAAGKKAADARVAAEQAIAASPQAPQLERVGGEIHMVEPDGTVSAKFTSEEAAAVAYQDRLAWEANGNAQAVRDLVAWYAAKDDSGKWEILPNKQTLDMESQASPESVAEQMKLAGYAAGTSSADVQVFGSNTGEVREGLYEDVSRLFLGSTPADVVHERTHSQFKRELASGAISMDAGEKAARVYLGDKAPATMSPEQIHEAVAEMGVDYFMGNLRKIDTLPASVKGFFGRMGAFFKAAFQRAAAMLKLKREGKLDADWEAFLARAVGVDSVVEQNRATAKAAQEMAGQPADPVSGSRATPLGEAPATVLPDGSTLIGPTHFSLRAFHGTPHKVDRFSLDKIGTGEGAQAYGWGLYFAEAQNVAKTYADTLGMRVEVKGQQVYRGKDGKTAGNAPISNGAIGLLQGKDWNLKEAQAEAAARAVEIKDDPWFQRLSDELQTLQEEDIKIDGGNLYTVDLLPDEADFLDWDKPLSEQSEKIRNAMEPLLANDEVWQAWKTNGTHAAGVANKGGDAYARLAGRNGMTRSGMDGRKSASKALLNAGIPGIRYLNSNSRDGGSGTSNYVIFDESLVQILEENGQAVSTGQAPAADAVSGSSFSLRPADYAERLAAQMDALKRNPTARVTIYENAKKKLSALVAQIRAEASAEPKDTRPNAEQIQAAKDAHAATLERLATEEAAATQAATTKQAQNGVRLGFASKRAAADRALAAALAQTTGQTQLRTRLIQSLAEYNAILSAFPAEVRGKVGGFVQLAEIKTDRGRASFFADRIDRLERELEKTLRKEYRAQLDRVLDSYRPKREEGKKPKGKIGAEAQQILDTVEAAMELDGIQIAAEVAKFDALANDPNTTPEDAIKYGRIRDMLPLLGDIKNADAARLVSAIAAVKMVGSEGWARWKFQQLQLQENRKDARVALVADTGKTGLRQERVAAEQAAASVVGKSRSLLLNLSSFSEVLQYVFGKNSTTATEFLQREREASNQREDATEKVSRDINDLFTQLAGTELSGEKLRFRMAQKSIDTKAGKFSELEGITAILMWSQEDGRRHMTGPLDENGRPAGPWNYDQAFVDQITNALSPEALKVLGWLRTQYDAEHAPLSALYQKRHGIALPQHENYSPLSLTPQQAKAGEVVDPLSGSVVSGSILTPGSLRSRSFTAVAEPDFRDALSVFIAHRKMLDHWAAYYDVAVDMQAVLANRDVTNAAKAKAGPEAAAVLRSWLDYFAQGGVRDAAAGLEVGKTMGRMIGRGSQIALFGRASVLMVQATQLAAASVKMPVGSYMLRLSKLLSGNLSWSDALNSQFIQRRISQQPAIVQQAMQALGAASSPNAIKYAARNVGRLISGADGLFTAGTYAILLDYHRGNAAAMGLTGPDAEAFAHAEAARDTETVAQPTRGANRSLAELTATHPMARLVWSFASEARQKVALTAWAMGSGNVSRMVKTGFLTFVVGGLFTQVLKNLWREMKGDDDERKWSIERLVLAALTGPLNGIPGFSAVMGDGGSLLAKGKQGIHAVEDLLTKDQSAVDVLKDFDTVLSAMGLFSDNAAALSVLTHTATDAAKLLQNMTDSEEP
jgi:hypothetical protein